MARGIIYLMETVVPGLIKIGKTGLDGFESRMYGLERNGYNNVVGLRRRFAIEVEDYDEKEALIHNLFDKSRLQNSELFAVDINLAIQLLASLDGKQIFPKNESKEDVFKDATQDRKDAEDWALIPDGVFYLNETIKGFGKISATMRVENGLFIVQKGSVCKPSNAVWKPASLRTAKIENNILMEDVVCKSPSTAAWIPTGRSSNGWITWKCSDGKPIDVFRKKKN
ncbi:MAG: DUF4357 domain-containing protein [Clostridia bacterium]